MPFTGYTGIFTNICSNFKAAYRAKASGYIVKRWADITAAQNAILPANLGSAVPQWSYSIPSTSASVGYTICPLSKIVPVNFGSVPITYYVTVDVTYNLVDAAGNSSVVTAYGNYLGPSAPSSGQGFTLNPEGTPLVVRSSDACPTFKELSSFVTTNRSVCGAAAYQWKFKLVQPAGLSLPLFAQGSSGSRILPLSVLGVTSGQRFDVWARTTHLDGVSFSSGSSVGNLGQINNWFPTSGSCNNGASPYCDNASCVRTIGSAGMVEEEDVEKKSTVQDLGVRIYPNPASDQQISIEVLGMKGELDVLIFDGIGTQVRQEKILSDGYLYHTMFFNQDIASGIYNVSIRNQKEQRTTRLMVLNSSHE
jgi:hypothetical protein